jgi:hypothetical protein
MDEHRFEFPSRILFKAHKKNIKMWCAEMTAHSSAQDHCYKKEQVVGSVNVLRRLN